MFRVFKYQVHWAWGSDSWKFHWVYGEWNDDLSDKEALEELGERLHERHGWSDKYRGWEIEKVENEEVILLEKKKFIDRTEDDIEELQKHLAPIKEEWEGHFAEIEWAETWIGG